MMELAKRIKRYESVSHHIATSRTPLMIRVDGRAFHTFTRDMDKPFDQKMIDAMVGAAKYVADEMQGFKVAYIQSDEVTFCITDYDKITSEGWFDYDLSKIISITASLMTSHFSRIIGTNKHPIFDCRAFSVPINDVVNTFLWRAKDWERNSLQMYSRSFFSHKQLHGKRKNDMHNMLHNIDKNWSTDLPYQHKNGTFLIITNEGIIERHNILPTYEHINSCVGSLFEM